MDEKYLGDTGTSPNYLLVDLGPYPGMVEKPLGGFSVQGELFEIPYALLVELDKIEGSPYLFHLEPIFLNDGSKAFAYLYKQSIQGEESFQKVSGDPDFYLMGEELGAIAQE
jgi:gamma-glutamylcyclotransferase (GGCT)/AIG2-like uncharacterized protein YtfP